MNYSIFLAILAMFATGTSDFLYKRAQIKGITPGSFLVVQAISFGLTAILFSIITEGIKIDTPILIYAPMCGVLFFIALMLYLRSLKSGEASINTIIFRLSFVVASIFAIFFIRESLSFIKMIGILMAMVAVIILSYKGREDSINQSILLAIIAMLSFGIGIFFYKVAVLQGASPTSFPIVQSIVFLFCAILYSLSTEGEIHINKTIINHAPFTGILLSSSAILLLESLKTGEASVNIPIVHQSFVVTSLLAIILLKERLTLRKIAGMIFTILAIFALSFSTS